jgi:hypothetical protein
MLGQLGQISGEEDTSEQICEAESCIAAAIAAHGGCERCR